MLSLLTLTQIKGVGSIRARHLIEAFGSAKAVIEADAQLLLQAGHVGQMVVNGRNDARIREKAERELKFIEDHHIHPLVYGQKGYPARLLECPDAPAMLFQLGDTDMESRHVVSIVGTRQATQYGRDCVQRLVAELHQQLPDLIIVSGLALGIDVASHRAALDCNVPTIGVVAHGLDRIYPYQHRDDARRIIQQGGSIITEYLSGTQPERGNFIARNRIIAGLADAVVVAESNAKGGSLVTASISVDYGRDVFAFPGRVGDSRSEGCNRLIRLNRAGLITSAQDLIEAMNWEDSTSNSKGIQQTLNFVEDNLSPQSHQILDALRDRGDMRISQLSDLTGLDYSTLTESLLDLEMDGKVRATPGGLYQLR